MKKFILLFALVSLLFQTRAQTYPGEPMFVPLDPVFMTYSVNDLIRNYSHHVHKVLAKDNTIAGSPYVYDDFRDGVVYSRKEKAAFYLKVNINAYTNLFEFLFEDLTYEMPNFAYDSVVIGRSKFIPVSVVENDRVILFTMEVIRSDGEGHFLLKKNCVNFIHRKEAGPYNAAEPAHFRKFPPEYYLYGSDNILVPLENLKKLGENKRMPEGVDSFIRKNKIRKSDEAGLSKLFDFVYS